MNGNIGVSVVMMLGFLGVLFISLGTVAGDFLSPNVASVSQILELSPDIAGVTLVAFGNASNDLIGNLISIHAVNSGALALGELLGSGLFLSCIVVGTITILSKEIQLRKDAVMRDIGFYLFGLMMVLMMEVFGNLKWFEGVFLLCLYLIYVLVVLTMGNDLLRGYFCRFRVWIRGVLGRGTIIKGTEVGTVSHNEILETPQITIQSEEDLLELHPTTPTSNNTPNIDLLPLPMNQDRQFLQVPGLNVPLPQHRRSKSLELKSIVSRSDSIHSQHSQGSQYSHGSQVSYRSTGGRKYIKPRQFQDYTPTDTLPLHLPLSQHLSLSPSKLSTGSHSASHSPSHSGHNLSHPHPSHSVVGSHSGHSGHTSGEEEISENILNLSMNDQIMKQVRGGSLSSAIELWSAWRILHDHDHGGVGSSSSEQPVFSAEVVDLGDVGDDEEIVKDLGISKEKETESRSILDFSIQLPLSVPLPLPLPTAVPVIMNDGTSMTNRSLNRISTATSASTIHSHYSQYSHHSYSYAYRHLSLLQKCDLCPTCYKCATLTPPHTTTTTPPHPSTTTTPAADTFTSVSSSSSIVVHHYFPILKLFRIQGITGRIVGIINFLPIFVFAMTIPVICIFDGDLSDGSRDEGGGNEGGNQERNEGEGVVREEAGSIRSTHGEVRQRSRSSSRSRSPHLERLEQVEADIDHIINPRTNTNRRKCPYGTLLYIKWKHRTINLIQLLFFPMMIVICFQSLSFVLGGLALWIYALILGGVIVLVVWICSRGGLRVVRVDRGSTTTKSKGRVCENRKCLYCLPYRRQRTIIKSLIHFLYTLKYRPIHPLLSLIGFVSGLLWIYLLSSEVISILKTLGHILSISDSILGVTIYTVGNCIGDLVTNVMISKMGYAQMSIAASWGAPMLNLLITLGIGISLLKSTMSEGGLDLERSPILICSLVGLLMVLGLNLVYLLKSGFVLRRWWGFVLVGVYCLVVAVNVLLEGYFHGVTTGDS